MGKIKFIVLLCIALIAISVMTASAEIYVDGYITYSITSDGARIVEVDNEINGNVIIPSEIKGSAVVEIGANAFENCNQLKSITIPGSVDVLGRATFQNCTSLESVNLLEGVTDILVEVFLNCTSLKEINLPSTLETIGIGAFSNCQKLENISLPSGINNIRSETFSNCNSLKTIDLSKVYAIQSGAFSGCTVLEEIIFNPDISSIGGGAFANSAWYNNQPDGLIYIGDLLYRYKGTMPEDSEITIKEGTESICSYAFGDCEELVSVEIPNSVMYVDDYAFDNCKNLKEMKLPESIVIVGCGTFNGCASLESINIPASLELIGYEKIDVVDAFSGCNKLMNIQVAEGNEFYASDEGRLYNKQRTTLLWCANEKEKLIIPEGVQIIGYKAFNNCSSTTSIQLPISISTIEEYAFNNLINLQDVYYLGTEQQWNEIEILWGNEILENVEIHYSMSYNDVVIAQGDCGENLKWKINGEGILQITGTGDMTDFGYDENKAPWDEYKDIVTDIFIEEGVTRIGSYAFCGWTRITSIEKRKSYSENAIFLALPDSIKSIGIAAFADNGLQKVNLPEYITSVEDDAFSSCTELKEIKLPETIEYIGMYAFWGCSKLDNVVMPEKLTSVEDGTFARCSNLRNITLGKNIEKIGYYAFTECASIETIVIPENTISINEFAFDNCVKLKNIEFNDKIQSIGRYAFSGCDYIKNINLPVSVKNIGNEAFSSYELTDIYYQGTKEQWESIDIDENNIVINRALIHFRGGDVFLLSDWIGNDGIYWKLYSDGTIVAEGNGEMTEVPYAYNELLKIRKVEIKEGITSIANSAFSNCSELTDVSVPKTIEKIDDWAFAYCTKLSNIKMSEMLSTIGTYAFYGCEKIEELEFAKALTTINDGAFYMCDNLKKVTYQGKVSDWQGAYIGIDNEYLMRAEIVFKEGRDVIVDSGICEDGLTWTLTDDGTLTISGSGPMKDYSAYGEISQWTQINMVRPIMNMIWNVVVEEGVTSIGSYAFDSCEYIQSVKIPASVVEIDPSAFSNCYYIKRFIVDEDNLNYTAVEGILFSKDKKEIVKYAGTKNIYRILECTEKVGDWAFAWNDYIEEVVFPKSIKLIEGLPFFRSTIRNIELPECMTSINYGMFARCCYLEKVTIPTNVKVIEQTAFRDSVNLAEIYYCGTKDMWEKIVVEAGNEAIKNAHIIYMGYIEAEENIEENKLIITPIADTIKGNILISVYDEDGTLNNVINEQAKNMEIERQTATKTKIMWVEDLSTLKPVTKPVVIE